MNLKKFDSLKHTDKHHAAQKALAWFCVLTTETIKIILGKYVNEKLEEKNDD